MNHLRKLAGISVLLTVIFMIAALLQFQKEDVPASEDEFEYFMSEGWTMASFSPDSQGLSEEELGDPRTIQKLMDAAQAEGRCQEVQLPYEGRSDGGRLLIFESMIPQQYAGLAMDFFSEGAVVHVILDGEVLCHPGSQEADGLQESSGNIESFVTIPGIIEHGRLWITLLSDDQQEQTPMLGEIRLKTRDKVVIGVVGNNIADIGCCLVIMIMSIIMFVLALVRWYAKQPSRGEVYLGLAGIVSGVYCFIGTGTLDIFYDLQEVYEMQEYLVLLLSLLLAQYFERNLHSLYPKRFFVLLGWMSVQPLLQFGLHFCGIQDLKNMGRLSALSIGAVCVTAVVSLMQYDYWHKSHQTVLTVLAFLVLLAGGAANVLQNVRNGGAHVNTAGQYSMTVFAVMMSIVHVLQLSREYLADVKERVRQARQQNIRLEQAKQEADAARQEALAANEAKGTFLAHMSHEIRTPINAVLGMDEMILREAKEKNIQEYAMDIYSAGQTLLSLINDILDFSKIESGKMEIVPVEYDLSSLIHDLANMAAQRAQDKKIKLETDVDSRLPSRLYGDDVRIRQVLTNILTNAVKYTHEGTVWLRVQSRMDGETAVLRFEVEDTGIGIKEEDLPKLSAEFERIEEDRNRNIEGTGLGMSITIQLLALLGSRLQVESVYGTGSKFYFDLEQRIIDHTPIGDFQTRVRQLAEHYSYYAKICAPQASILVVDDNAVNRKVLRSLLKETQIQVTDAQGGKECLELVQHYHYDLIFLDHMMPEMDGVETLHHIRALSDFPCKDTPIVVLTANAVTGAKEAYLAEGFDGFLSKPVVPEKLEQMLLHMLPDELKIQTGGQDEGGVTQPDPAGQPVAHHVKEDAWEGLAQVDGLDWQYAWMHLPDRELLEYTVKEFYHQLSSAADRLEQSFANITAAALKEPEGSTDSAWEQHLDAYRIQVHAMKSLAATVGILPLSGVARMLEYAARDGNTNVVISVTPPFLAEWRSYREKLQGVFGIGEEARKEVTDTSVIQALVEMVRVSMQEMDIDQADQLMDQLREYTYSGETEETMQRLAEAVTSLDAEETERLAGILLESFS
ncbi:MAG: response regulator [Eubacterium sp.]|nr:response regulator [Eubacterium sp.]